MAGEKRNTHVIACVIAAMTLGAALLLWMEPESPGWSKTTLLMAESVPAVEEVRIEYLEPLTREHLETFDCLVLPDGQCDWRPRQGAIRLGVVGINAQPLSEKQKYTLLAVVGSLSQRHGLDIKRVWLDPSSDARLHPELPDGARGLAELLVRKGIIP